MPIQFAVDPGLDLWYVVGTGHATGTEYVACMKASVEDPHFHLDIDLLLDLRSVAELDVSLAEVKKIFALDKTLFGNQPQRYRAAVLARNLTDRMLTQLYAAMVKSSGVHVSAFYQLRDALRWLDRPQAEAEVLALRETMLAPTTA